MSEATFLRACDVLHFALPKGSPPLADSEIVVACEKCGDVTLSSCFLTLKRETVYTCTTCGKPVVILAIPNADETPWMEGAYRLNQFVIWHPGELRFRGVVPPPLVPTPPAPKPAPSAA